MGQRGCDAGTLKSLMEKVFRSQIGLEGLEIHEVKEFPCTKPGDNYMSVVCLVKIKGTLPGGKEYNRSVFVKRQPESEERKQMFQTEAGFSNEVTMYERVLPLYDITVATARSLYATTDVIVLEDLRAAGYAMMDRRRGFELHQASLVLKALARLHAASYHALVVGNKQYTRAVDHLKPTGFVITANRDMSESAMRRVIRQLKGQGVDETITFMETLQGRFSERLQSLREPKHFKVLCHGDFWINNVLIREGSDPVKIVDLQNCAVISPAVDLWTFLYTSVHPPIMESAFPQLLRTFCSAFLQEVSLLKVPPELSPSPESVMDELLSKELYGFLVGTLYIPAILMAEDNMPDFDTLPKDVFLDDFFMDQYTGPDIKDRMRDLARLCEKRGVFQNS